MIGSTTGAIEWITKIAVVSSVGMDLRRSRMRLLGGSTLIV
ncbi:hypothetical protein SynA1560_02142 [Synechococcus sp. A15-60]|nr:hypothetical protein SynA1560_02142 [Synechococcus sp. A15-60]